MKTHTTNPILSGALAGLIGSAVFGMLLAMMGMLPMVGKLVGQENAIVGLIVHLAISAIIGAIYAVAVARMPAGRLSAVLAGMVNGVVWWVLGALVLMPLGLGMPQMVFAPGLDPVDEPDGPLDLRHRHGVGARAFPESDLTVPDPWGSGAYEDHNPEVAGRDPHPASARPVSLRGSGPFFAR